MSEQRTALVTGANRGIGLEVCRQLAAHGYRVILTARDSHKSDAAASSLSGDVTGDVLVNNAAVLIGESTAVLQTTDGDLRGTFETNLFGVVSVSAAFVPGMIAR